MSSKPFDDWKVEAVLGAILEVADEQGRILCPPFRVLPSPEKLPLYYETIKSPIDLQQISKKSREGEYSSWNDVSNDFKLLFKNAKIFNEPNSVIYEDAVFLNTFTQQKINEFKDLKRISAREINKNRGLVNELLSQVDEGEDDISEDSDEESQENVDDNMKKIYWVLRNHEVKGETLCELFLAVPERSCYPDYYEDIANPMSFYLINKKLKQSAYADIEEFCQDFSLIFSNAMSYNMPGSACFDNARKLEALLVKTLKDMKINIAIETFKEPLEEKEVEEEFEDASVVSKGSHNTRPKRGRKSKVIEPDLSPAPSSASATRTSFSRRLSVNSDENSNSNDATSPTRKRHKPPPPSRLPGAAETRLQLIPKRNKRDPNGPKLKPGRKSFNELRERYKLKLLEVYRAVYDYNDGGHQLCKAFMYLPSRKEYPDYYQVIDTPIDMTTIRHRAENGDYKTSEEFMEDFRLLFRNARKYNIPESQICAAANILEQLAMSTMMKVTNNTVLHYPPPSKRVPNFFTEDSLSPSSSSFVPSPPKKVEKAPRPSLSAPQYHMLSILDSICGYKDETGRVLADRFKKLPSKIEYPEYYDIIKKPMDLNKIKQKIINGQYDSLRIFLSETNLVFDNACKFNEPDSEIYRDALTLQKELMEIKAELLEDSSVPSVQVQVRRILTNLLVYLSTYIDSGRVLADSLSDISELFKQNGIETVDMPFTLDQIRVNVDKHRYRRLDRFQDDLFALFNQVRAVSAPSSQLFQDVNALQLRYIYKRDELCRTLLVSPASTYNESMLNDEIAEQIRISKRALKEEENEKEVVQEDPENSTSMETEEKTLDEVEVEGIKYKPKEFVYVSSGDPNHKSTKHILRIVSIKPDAEKENVIIINGTWVYKPSETYHLATRKFYTNEVFITDFSDNVTLDRLHGKCFVMFADDFMAKAPKDYEADDIFICDHKYLGRKLHFKRLTQWPFDDETVEYEERKDPLTLEKTITSQFIEGVTTLPPKVEDDAEDDDEDERMKGLPFYLDVHRTEVPLKRSLIKSENDEEAMEVDQEQEESSQDITYFEQICNAGQYYRHGDFVLVYNPRKAYCDVMRIEKMWQTPTGERYFSGSFFARPKEITHEPSVRFYKREVVAVEERERVELIEKIQARCYVLTVKQFETYRPTEVPECDIFVVDHKVSGDPRDQSTFMKYIPGKNYRKIKPYSLSGSVPDDELFYFKKPVTMEKDLSSQVTKVETTLPVDVNDLENEDRHVTEQLENPSLQKDVAWLASQPKLNAKSKSGYILFSAEIRKRIMNENPEAGFGEVSKIVGVEWKKLSDEQKRQYETRASFIAEERAKNDLLTPNSKMLQPGEIRVYVCRWHGCDFQFDHADGLFEHLRVSHASTDEGKFVEENETHYVCLWMTCVKYRQNGKPFPSLPRLLRHMKEKHIPSAAKVIQPSQRGKHFFHYMPTSEPTTNSTKDQSHGMFINQPNGISNPQAVPHKVAIPLDHISSPTTSNGVNSHTPQTVHGPSTSGVTSTPVSHHQIQQQTPAQQVYVQQTPQSQPGTTHQVVQVINGSSVAYLNTSNAPYQVILNPQPSTISAQPGQQIVVQHAVSTSSSQPHIVLHNGTQAQVSTLQPGQYAIHQAPGLAHSAPHSGQHVSSHPYYPSVSQSGYSNGNLDNSRIIAASNKQQEPLFVPPPNSIKVKRVLHSETYYKYVDSLNKARLKSCNSDRPPRLRTDQKKAAMEWMGKSDIKVRDDELVKALYRLRDDMLENVVGIKCTELNIESL